jgi:hypothetical protein
MDMHRQIVRLSAAISSISFSSGSAPPPGGDENSLLDPLLGSARTARHSPWQSLLLDARSTPHHRVRTSLMHTREEVIGRIHQRASATSRARIPTHRAHGNSWCPTDMHRRLKRKRASENVKQGTARHGATVVPVDRNTAREPRRSFCSQPIRQSAAPGHRFDQQQDQNLCHAPAVAPLTLNLSVRVRATALP